MNDFAWILRLVATFGRYQAPPPLRCGTPIFLDVWFEAFCFHTAGSPRRCCRGVRRVFPSAGVQASCDHKIHLRHGSAPHDTGTLQRHDGLAVRDSLFRRDRLEGGRVGAPL